MLRLSEYVREYLPSLSWLVGESLPQKGGVEAVYLRVSTKEQDVKLQLESILRLRKEYNPDYASHDALLFVDEGLSAWKREEAEARPGFNMLIQLIRDGRISKLYVYDWDRFYRRMQRLLEFWRLLRAYKVKLYSVRQRVLLETFILRWERLLEGDEAGDFLIKELLRVSEEQLIVFLSYMAEQESQRISDRIRRAMRRTENGTVSVYGKKWGRKRILTNHKKAWILKYREQGMSIREIAKRLNVSKSSVQKILSEESLEKPAENTTSKKEVISGQ